MILGNCPVQFVKGEPYEYKIRCDDNMSSFVSKVCISCSQYAFCHNLTQNSIDTTEWSYLFPAEETDKFLPNRTTYSLTVYCTEPNINPQILTEQLFEVKDNKNKCKCQGV